jgi:hypothetical protein
MDTSQTVVGVTVVGDNVCFQQMYGEQSLQSLLFAYDLNTFRFRFAFPGQLPPHASVSNLTKTNLLALSPETVQAWSDLALPNIRCNTERFILLVPQEVYDMHYKPANLLWHVLSVVPYTDANVETLKTELRAKCPSAKIVLVTHESSGTSSTTNTTTLIGLSNVGKTCASRLFANGLPGRIHETDSGNPPADEFIQHQTDGQPLFWVVGNNPQYDHPFSPSGGDTLLFTELPQPAATDELFTHTIRIGMMDGVIVHIPTVGPSVQLTPAWLKVVSEQTGARQFRLFDENAELQIGTILESTYEGYQMIVSAERETWLVLVGYTSSTTTVTVRTDHGITQEEDESGTLYAIDPNDNDDGTIRVIEMKLLNDACLSGWMGASCMELSEDTTESESLPEDMTRVPTDRFQILPPPEYYESGRMKLNSDFVVKVFDLVTNEENILMWGREDGDDFYPSATVGFDTEVFSESDEDE